MNEPAQPAAAPAHCSGDAATTEILILPDGRLLVHNLSPAMAAIISELNPQDDVMRQRGKLMQAD